MPLLTIIGCHGNQNAKKKKKKTTKNTFKNLLWNHWSDWAQILHVASFGLGNESFFFFFLFFFFFYENLPISLVAMATYSFHWLLMEKTEKWHLLPNSWRYFDQNFIDIFLLFMKTSLSVKLLWPTFTFHVLIMGKIENFQLVTYRCRYFDKQNDPQPLKEFIPNFA